MTRTATILFAAFTLFSVAFAATTDGEFIAEPAVNVNGTNSRELGALASCGIDVEALRQSNAKNGRTYSTRAQFMAAVTNWQGCRRLWLRLSPNDPRFQLPATRPQQ